VTANPGTSLRSRYVSAKERSAAGGFVTVHFSNRLGALIAAAAMRLGWHPTHLSLGSVVAAAAASIPLIALASEAHRFWLPGWFALIGWTLAYALDCADGQLARATGKKSEYGARVDVLADYVAQILIVAALAVVAAAQSAPTVFIAVMCSLWFFGTLAAVLRRSDVEEGHGLLGTRWHANLLHTVMDTGFVNLLLGVWMALAPSTILLPASAFTWLNASYLLMSLVRETRLSLLGSHRLPPNKSSPRC